jgi:hypothetical protein
MTMYWMPAATVPLFSESQSGNPTLDVFGMSLDLLMSTAAGEALLNVSSSGAMIVGTEDGGFGETQYEFDYDDSVLVALTRRADNQAGYNVVRTLGDDGTGATTDEVSDAADVVKRGRVVYPALWGARWMPIAEANRTAAEYLANGLRGAIDFETPFNPFLALMQRVRVGSVRANVPAGLARIRQFQHQYSIGRAVTYVQQAVLT